MYNKFMQEEIEVKFANVDHDSVRDKLTALGATCVQPMRQMTRQTFDIPGAANFEASFVRVRDEGDKVTMTYKEFTSKKDVIETELVVDSFERACDFCSRVGLIKKALQESKRETWRYGDCEIVLDEWPWLVPYIEIEGPSFAALERVSVKLGFDFKDGIYGDVTDVYRVQYPHLPDPAQIGILPEIRFGAPPPDFLDPEVKLAKYTK